jgi:hypothetical protein
MIVMYKTGNQQSLEPKKPVKLIYESILKGILFPYIPLLVGLALILFSKGANAKIAISMGLFIVGFEGILNYLVHQQKPLSSIYSRSRLVADILSVLVLWSMALYVLLK